MGNIEKKIEWFFNWLEHGNTLVAVLGSLGVGKLLQALLSAHSKIPSVYEGGVWFIASALILAIFLFLGRSYRKRKPRVTQSVSIDTRTGNFDVIEPFYKAHNGPMMEELQAGVRKYVEKYRGQDREDFFIRSLATVVMVAMFDETWHTIFGSQILALERLNKSMTKMDDLYPYYQQDSEKRPQYSFESWFGYLKSNVLIIQDGYNIAITVRGKEFLKYLVNFGRTAKDKPF